MATKKSTKPRAPRAPKESRSDAIRRITTAEYAKGTPLASVRKALAATLGGDPSIYLGTADPIYYRLVGLDSPLTDPKGKHLPKSPTAAALRSAIRRRRDSGVRWNVLAASAEATLGRKVSVAEAKSLYAKAGGDLDSSYAGRGTRVAAPATYADLAAAAEAATK